MSDAELFVVQDVTITMKPEDTPGVSIVRTFCAVCGDAIIDRREVVMDSKILCRSCASGETYFSTVSAVRLPKVSGSELS
jgi:formylmethanofuran dehydrogenase subunit E